MDHHIIMVTYHIAVGAGALSHFFRAGCLRNHQVLLFFWVIYSCTTYIKSVLSAHRKYNTKQNDRKYCLVNSGAFFSPQKDSCCQAARDARVACPSYTKALFREAKAMLGQDSMSQ